MKKVAIVQSSYIPWKGYFDLIAGVDEFILLDDVQYTKRDWRNRNRIKTLDGIRWLTIPVQVKGKFKQSIKDVKIANGDWSRRHWKSLGAAYGRAPCFNDYRDFVEGLYMDCREPFLSQVNRRFIEAICGILGIRTEIKCSSDFLLSAGKTERLVSMCRQSHATNYRSGPKAKDYLDEGQFAQAGMTVSYMDYSDYPVYNQLYPPFHHNVSILDLIFNEGDRARQFMKY